MKKIILMIMSCFTVICNTCFAQEPAPFHDSYTIRDYYERVSNYLSTMLATGHYFYDTVNGLDTHMVVFDNNYENILFIATQENKIVQIVSSDNNEPRLNEKIIASLRVFGANVSESDLIAAQMSGSIMVTGNDRNFIIRYEKPDFPTYILYAAK